ncbi:Hypothetical protein PP7435_CHR1-0563 [Komagataella phaffii CBS 7435]|uniref:Uncharacterized protein n=2 Tax=Komagataella phaffii TaxID=460519 RepID=C4QWJ8_KOMPG|nr:Hypothetical protein PAS_chr1-1_0251 [Komagataella phaffii GS115]AOA61056.1 GQ67_02832T0 [Komagataella phaffii]CAH2446323.1 Hypothetical protein BQ9382_C1-2905 [Komagataella phaffii CBS 7435]AOA66388.1 GQ68_02415T0 [Komagataella phaffii GS115]CAY67621.1 Hypothetical protein PAS_chr1-1_0251 [Komagataella phaffii GS115]CCA36713.1 Hypothetical protein PP7435_CHR1-0563 [Komagataella phaffii CBS 7435]
MLGNNLSSWYHDVEELETVEAPLVVCVCETSKALKLYQRVQHTACFIIIDPFLDLNKLNSDEVEVLLRFQEENDILWNKIDGCFSSTSVVNRSLNEVLFPLVRLMEMNNWHLNIVGQDQTGLLAAFICTMVYFKMNVSQNMKLTGVDKNDIDIPMATSFWMQWNSYKNYSPKSMKRRIDCV